MLVTHSNRRAAASVRAEALERRVLFAGVLVINDVSVSEGDSGARDLIFTVERLAPSSASAVMASTSDGTPSAAGDAIIADGTGVGTILEDDDHPPTVTLESVPEQRDTPIASTRLLFS